MTQAEKLKVTLVMLYSFAPLGVLAWATPERQQSCELRELLARHTPSPVLKNATELRGLASSKMANHQQTLGRIPASVTEPSAPEYHCLKRLRQ